jgi:hypothetical protein
MTLDQLRTIITVRLAVLGEELACLVEDGNTDCNPRHEELLCIGFKLYSMIEASYSDEGIAELIEENSDLINDWSQTASTAGGIKTTDYLNVDGDLYISFLQYYSNWGNTSNGSSGGSGGGNANFTPINSIGRNFTTPTLFNQSHVYNTLDELINAWLFPAINPTITSWSGSMTINGGTGSSLTLIERGQIVRDITVTMIAARASANSGLLASASTTLPSPSPSSPTNIDPDAANHTQIWTTTVNGGGVTDWAGADKTNKSFTATVIDTNSKSATSSSIGYSFGNYVYYGVSIIGTVDETFIKSLTPVLDTDQYRNPIAYSVGSNQHAWFFYPDSWGDVVFTDNALNISGGFTRINGVTTLPNGEIVIMTPTITLTFNNGYTESYRGYITDNHTLGSISFRTTAS